MKARKAVTYCRACGGDVKKSRHVGESCGHDPNCSGCGSCQHCPICGTDRHKGACPKRKHTVPIACPGGDRHKATCPDRKTKIAVTVRELATVLAALRYWQKHGPAVPVGLTDHFHDHKPLSAKEIDALCERLNMEGE